MLLGNLRKPRVFFADLRNLATKIQEPRVKVQVFLHCSCLHRSTRCLPPNWSRIFSIHQFYFTLMPPYLLVQRPVVLREGDTATKGMSCDKYPCLSPCEVAERLSDEHNELLLVDCRSLVAFNFRHIKGAIHINCSGIGRKRLSQGKAKVKDLISSAEGKKRFASESAHTTLVVYDELSSGHGFDECNPCKPIFLVLETLLKEGRATSLLKGKYIFFLHLC